MDERNINFITKKKSSFFFLSLFIQATDITSTNDDHKENVCFAMFTATFVIIISGKWEFKLHLHCKLYQSNV